MKVHYPSFNEYQAVLQNPAHCFSSPELKSARIETDLWGLPRVRSGGFALTYKLLSRGRGIAVRCFHRHVADRTQRYAAISSFLAQNPSDIFIPIMFQPNGVLVRGDWFPITTMGWVEGDTLEACVVKNVHNREMIRRLSAELVRVVSELERLGIAHGDLSHRNILVQNEKMVLVDYDGLYVPELKGRKSCEVGNVHFQLPGRTDAHFNAALDCFSEIVIYLALEALALNPTLWERYETGGEGLLFQREDFLNPYQSVLLQEIELLPGLKPLVAQFRRICTSDVTRVPRLADFIEARPVELLRSEAPVHAAAPPPVYDAVMRFSLLAKVGKIGTVVGRVEEVFRGTSKGGEPHVFLNFGNWRGKCFTIVLWNEALQLLEATGRAPEEYQGQWIQVSGMLTSYERRPQIAVYSPTDIHFLRGEVEARELIAASRQNALRSTPVAAAPKPASRPGTNPPVRSAKAAGTLDQSREVRERLDKLYQHLPDAHGNIPS